MAIQALIPYALAAYGGYQGYQSAKDSGASGIGRLLGAAGGAYGGYTLGNMIPGVQAAPFTSLFSTAKPVADMSMSQYGMSATEIAKQEAAKKAVEDQGKRTIMEKLLMKKATPTEYDPLKVSALAAGIPLALGAFDQGPTDIYQPTYNVAYANFAEQRPGYTYIDPQTGAEKKYEKVYIPEADPKNQGDMRVGPYAMEKTRLRTGGLAEIKNVNYRGWHSNDYICKHITDYQIFPYSNNWEETSCISAIEALGAGLHMITTNYGALFETCSEWPVYVQYDTNYKNMSECFAYAIDSVVDYLHHEKCQEHLQMQQDFYKKFYSWSKRSLEWTNFLQGVLNAKS